MHSADMDMPHVTFDEEHFTRSPAFDVAALFFFSAIVFLSGLSGGGWLSDHEAIIAQGARQNLQGENWLIPHVGDTPFIRKPPLPFWIVASTSSFIDPSDMALPVSPLSARLPSAVAAVLTTILVYAMGRLMFGHRIAMIAGLVMACSVGALFFSHEGQVEMVLTFLCTLSFAAFWMASKYAAHRRLFLAIFYAALALAMLAKAPFPLGVVIFPLACWWFVTIPLARVEPFLPAASGSRRSAFRVQVSSLRHLGIPWGGLLFFCVFLPWPLYIYYHVEGALELWRLEFLARYTGDLYGANHSLLYYVGIALGWMLPFSFALPEALASPFLRAYQAHRANLLFVFTWVVAVTVFLSTSAFKVPRYWIVCIPGCALLLAPTLDRFFFAHRTFRARYLRIARALIMGLIVGGMVVGAFVVMKRYPDQLHIIAPAAVIAGLGSLAACAAFTPGRRALCVLTLVGTSVLGFVFSWENMTAAAMQTQTSQLVTELKNHAIGIDEEIIWVDGRPDARFMYYTGMQFKPLFDDRELGAMREGRRNLPPELRLEGLRRITEILASDSASYLIIKARLLDFSGGSASFPMREVFRVTGSKYRDDDDLVVITNEWNTAKNHPSCTR